jgi:hypothetical protein
LDIGCSGGNDAWILYLAVSKSERVTFLQLLIIDNSSGWAKPC